MGFDLRALECFIAVAETKSFTKASARMNRTQSAVSQQIIKLEMILGKLLLNRTKHLSLTSDGEMFYGYAKQICKLHRQLLDQLKEPELEGEIRFGLPEDFATVFLEDVLVDFLNIYPRVLLHVECDLTLNLFERFKKNEFDMVLVKMSKPEDFPNGLEVWSEKLEWIGNKDFFSTGNDQKLIPLVLSPEPCLYRSRAIHALQSECIKWQLVFSSTSHTSKMAAVQAGLGISILPRSMIPKQLSILGNLPILHDTHVSLLKHSKNNLVVNSFESFILKKLQASC